MIRQILAAGISAIALAAATAPALAQDAPAQSNVAAPAASTAPTMTFGTWGVDTTQIDPALTPGDDFNAYVNARWMAANEIPADRTRYGAFDMLREKSSHDVQQLVNDLVASNPAAGTTERRIVDAYNSYLDTAAIDAAGLAPAQPYLSAIASAPDLAGLVRLFAREGYPGMVSAGVTVDDADPNTYVVGVGFNGMGLPDRDYYLVDSERNLEIRAEYKRYLAFLLGKAGYADPAATAETVYAFELQVAELEWDRAMLRNPELTYNILDRDQLAALSPTFPMAALLAEDGFGEVDRFSVAQILPDAEERARLGLTDEQMASMGGGLPAFMTLLTETPLDTLKAYMAAQFINAHADVLPSDVDAAAFAFNGTFLNGQPQQEPRWKRAIAAVEGQLGEQLGALYTARFFPPEAKAQMDELVQNLIRAQRADIDSASWIADATRTEARAKIDNFMPMIGYPAEFETYDGLEIRGGDALGNRMRAIRWAINDNRSRLGGPVDKTEWGMLPQTVNAYYNPVFNQIVFPAAILQQPFFGASADAAVNYGAIGAVIGHEIGHGFDDQGSLFDGSGALRNWWTQEDRTAFLERAAGLGAQIDAWCPLDNGTLCLKSGLDMGEALGDLVGLNMAYRAYRLSLDGQEAPVIDGLTGDQRFFLGFAQVWRGMIRPERLRSQIMSDPHPPSDFRLNNTVRNLDAWYEAFNVQPGDALYLPPEQRVRIW
jgi:putative endopeptidase